MKKALVFLVTAMLVLSVFIIPAGAKDEITVGTSVYSTEIEYFYILSEAYKKAGTDRVSRCYPPMVKATWTSKYTLLKISLPKELTEL